MPKFKTFWVTSAMTTMSHKYLAYTLYDVDTVNKIMSERTGQSLEQITADTERDNFMSAEEAMEFGLIDKIITGKK